MSAAWSAGGERVIEPGAYRPDALADALATFDEAPLAVGDGVLRFRDALAAGGVASPASDPALHHISGTALCGLGAAADVVARDALLPDYRREPDAKPPRPS